MSALKLVNVTVDDIRRYEAGERVVLDVEQPAWANDLTLEQLNGAALAREFNLGRNILIDPKPHREDPRGSIEGEVTGKVIE